nr:reverse transcriptase domain-containing protein [Tanacetum cinerariifolium]
MLFGLFVANETEKIDKYISRLPDNIYGSVKSSRPKTLDETIELANEFMDQKLCTDVQRQTDNKRKANNSSKNNHGHYQQPAKRQNVAKVYNMGSGHFARYCRSSGNTNVANAQRDNWVNPKGNGCFECGAPGYFKNDCPKLKNKDGGNVNAQGWVYAVGNEEKKGNASRDPDSNVVTGNSYDVELADGKIVTVDTIMRGCTLNLLNHPFNIDLMPVELGSFKIIIGMDWLRRCHAMIVCDEKLVRVPYGNETLIFRDLFETIVDVLELDFILDVVGIKICDGTIDGQSRRLCPPLKHRVHDFCLICSPLDLKRSRLRGLPGGRLSIKGGRTVIRPSGCSHSEGCPTSYIISLYEALQTLVLKHENAN